MSGRVFICTLILLVGLSMLTSPTLFKSVWPAPTSEVGSPQSTITPTVTATVDPFGHIPTATPLGGSSVVEMRPTGSTGTQSVGVTPQPSPTSPLPDASAGLTSTWSGPSTAAFIPPAPTPAGKIPGRLVIPRLKLDVPIEPVGMVPSDVAPGVVEWQVPDHRAAGWLNTSAPFGQSGNTVLAGHHNIKGEVFRDLWTLQAGDEILVYTEAGQQRHYKVGEVVIVPEKDQPLEVRLVNTGYILPTEDERLTLVTCWPYDNNTHRTLVVAYPS